MPRKLTDGVAIGEVTGDYTFNAEDSYKHSRPGELVPESRCRATRSSRICAIRLGALMTICEIKRNGVLDRVRAVLETGADPGSLLGKQGVTPAQTPDEEADAEDYAVDIEDIANQQIVSLIKSEFAGHALADLVAEILRVEGYTTKVSASGPDQGVDILAAGGTLGLGEDRICVQVKSGDGAANHDVVLRLIGFRLEHTGADRPSGQHRRRERGRPEGVGQQLLQIAPLANARSAQGALSVLRKPFGRHPRQAAPETDMGADIGR